uniref:Uncharacterized protein n=1 Tax=Aegilops tauschii subsp. strangulata TaxID=200361 RepID=A0A453GFU2_AEGTS
ENDDEEASYLSASFGPNVSLSSERVVIHARVTSWCLLASGNRNPHLLPPHISCRPPRSRSSSSKGGVARSFLRRVLVPFFLMDGGQSVAKRHGAAAGAEEDPDRHRAPPPVHEAADDQDDGDKKAPRQGSRRVASLDVFRGLTVAVGPLHGCLIPHPVSFMSA